MNELVKVKVNKNLGTIDSNLDAVKTSIESYIKDYENYAVSEDTVKDSKQLVADLRKQQKALDDERKQIKKEWNAPFTEWEKKAKDVIALYDKPIILINDQLLKFEEDRKAKKKEDIKVAYLQIVAAIDMNNELEDYCPIEKIYDAKWENASVSMKIIKEEIQQKLEAVGLQLSTIRSMESKFEDKGLAEYKRTLDLQAAIQLMMRYQKQEEEILARQEAERKAKEERERLEAEQKEKEERERLEAEQKAKAEPFPDLPEMEEEFVEPLEEFEVKEKPFEVVLHTMKVTVPADKLDMVKEFLRANQIEWRFI